MIDNDDSTVLCTGMELRDYFAAQVMNGFMAAISRSIDVAENKRVLAQACYEMADAMIDARSKQQ